MRNTQASRLTEEQILKLLNRYREKRDTRARDRLVTQYTNLVESVGRRFAGAGEPVEDLVQEGYIGLISAVEGFDVSKGVKFSTYATHFVIGQIKHYLRDKGKIIKEPAWLQELNQRMTRVIESLAQQFGRAPAEAEIASVMKISEDDVREMLTTREVFKVSSLDGDRDDPTGSLAADAESAKRLKYETFQLPLEDRMVLETSVERLKNIEQDVIHEYYFKDLNQTEIARKLGISCNYVSHILRNSTKKLRKIITTEDIREVQIQMRSMHKHAGARGVTPAAEVTDSATELYSRAYFLARLEEELSRASRHGYPVAAMVLTMEYMCDSGRGWTPMSTDERLFRIGQIIRSRVRKADIVARYNDHQIGLVLPHTGSAGARVCERIRDIVEQLNGEHAQELLTLRGTLTFVTYPEEASNFTDVLVAIEQGEPLVVTSTHACENEETLVLTEACEQIRQTLASAA
ncbi:MAG: sigma-70 family RNA polymerase sigma factor [Armatimonadetes bacterium]|nr:sigma-70 family RNA polymerase sigma factor [Armatimonadota bacterium]